MSCVDSSSCPICMDDIISNTNCVTTECGHCFHASCLMTNVAHNGFGCPYCRTVMAEEQEDDDSEYNVVSDDGLSDDDDENEEENALRGFRLFFNRVEGTQVEQSDLDEEYNFGTALEEEAAEEAAEAAAAAAAAPSVDAVVKTLKDQGVTYEQMVRLILYHDHKEYDFLDADRFTDELFGKIRIMVSNYVPVVVPDLSVVI